jgi:hypothetical protein
MCWASDMPMRAIVSGGLGIVMNVDIVGGMRNILIEAAR